VTAQRTPIPVLFREAAGTRRVPFGARLLTAITVRGPLCVGIDPHPALLDAWGLPRTAAGLETFVLTVLEAVGERVAAVKPQSAFFEAYGSAGVAVLERLLATAGEAGAITVMDAKRGDIGSTMAAYAAAYLTDGSPLAADVLTVSPYLGFGSLQPAIDAALASGRGLFVLARTSNPEGGEVQAAVGPDGRTVAQTIVDAAASCNAEADPVGSVGLVVGATVDPAAVDLGRLNGPVLAPGLGAQGGTPEDLPRVFGADLRGLLPSSSREILSAGPSVGRLRDAADRTVDQVRALLG
jgi:orotidine-5'-phosphate decarboxylase